MATLKRKGHRLDLSDVETQAYVGKPGEVTNNTTTGRSHMHDGVTPGGFEVSDDNTLTIEEIQVLLDSRYLQSESIKWKTMSGVVRTFDVMGGGLTSPYLVRSSDLVTVTGNIKGYLFENTDTNEVWSMFKLGEDYVPTTPINFFIDWIPGTVTAGNVIWGVEYLIVQPNAAVELNGTSLVYLNQDNAGGTAPTVQSVELDAQSLIADANLAVGATILVRFFRYGSTDTYNDNVYMINCGVKYQGV